MNIVFIILGIVVGGMLSQFGGAVCGGVIGFLYGSLQALQQRQETLERELASLRDRSAFTRRDSQATAATPVAMEEEIIILTGRDLLPEDEAVSPPGAPPPREQKLPKREPASRPQWTAAAEIGTSTTPLWLQRLCSGENLLVKLGVLILFFGVSFLVKYVAQRGLFPIELRLIAAALGGCGLLAIGWRVRGERPVYAQVIQGGGIGILYLTTYAAMALYQLLPTAAGFLLLIVTSALAAALALLQDARPLAVMGTVGGFLAPQLASIGSGSPAMLFGYYAVLNGGILALARQRAWRELNLLGFAGTFIVSALWGSRFYRPEYFFSVEPFLVLFFLMYAVLPVLHARKEPTVMDGYQDCILVFGTPLLAFAFQAALVRQFEYGLAWSALAAGVLYLSLAKQLLQRDPQRLHSLAEAFLALRTVFVTLAIPLAFEGRWTSAAWSLEGAALVWTGLRQQRSLARAFGYLLLVASGIVFLADNGLASGVWPLLNSSYSGCLLLAGAALFSARLLGQNRETLAGQESFAEPLLFAWGLFWWFAGGLNEVSEHTVNDLTFGALLLFIAASCLACRLLRERLDWQLLEWPALGLLPAMAVFCLLQLSGTSLYPTAQGGWLGWPAALAAWYLILRRSEGRGAPLTSLTHSVPLWLLTLLISWELHGRISLHLPGMATWALCAWGALPALVVLLLTRYRERLPWPVAGHSSIYLGAGALPLALFAGLWLLLANLTQAGNPWPLPYLPLVNPLDATTLLVLISLIGYYRTLEFELPQLAEFLPRREAEIVLAATGFLWFNAILLRTIHYWHGVPYNFEALFASLFVQTTLSIVWSLLALVLMVLATRRGLRSLWLAGGALLGVVVGKLFLIDLAGHGSVARIVSFVSVGLLLLLVGWFAPVPPRGAN